VPLLKWVSDALSIQADTINLNSAAGSVILGVTSGKKIIGPFQFGNPSGRPLFTANAANSAPLVGVVPTGTATIAGFAAHGGSDPDNAAELLIYADGSTATYVNSTKVGTGTARPLRLQFADTTRIEINTTGIGFFAATPVAKPTVTGSKGANAALANLLTALASLGLLTDGSS
jgi:hypothetical protein